MPSTDPKDFERCVFVGLLGTTPAVVTESLCMLFQKGVYPHDIHLLTTRDAWKSGPTESAYQTLIVNPDGLSALFQAYSAQIVTKLKDQPIEVLVHLLPTDGTSGLDSAGLGVRDQLAWIPAGACQLFKWYVINEQPNAFRSNGRNGPRRGLPTINSIGLRDVRTSEESNAVARYVDGLISRLTQVDSSAIHASIAGGRKTMSALLSESMNVYGRLQDRKSHVVANEDGIKDSISNGKYPERSGAAFFLKPEEFHDFSDEHACPIQMSEIPLVPLRHFFSPSIYYAGPPVNLYPDEVSATTLTTRMQQCIRHEHEALPIIVNLDEQFVKLGRLELKVEFQVGTNQPMHLDDLTTIAAIAYYSRDDAAPGLRLSSWPHWYRWFWIMKKLCGRVIRSDEAYGAANPFASRFAHFQDPKKQLYGKLQLEFSKDSSPLGNYDRQFKDVDLASALFVAVFDQMNIPERDRKLNLPTPKQLKMWVNFPTSHSLAKGIIEQCLGFEDSRYALRGANFFRRGAYVCGFLAEKSSRKRAVEVQVIGDVPDLTYEVRIMAEELKQVGMGERMEKSNKKRKKRARN